MNTGVDFIDIDRAAAPVRIEYCWLGRAASARPLIVFLHEGLGSLAMWKDFPERLCRATNCRGLVYSRPGYGASTVQQACLTVRKQGGLQCLFQRHHSSQVAVV